MASLPEGTVFRNAFEERANQIALKLQADGRMVHSQSYDYSVPGQLTVTCRETEGGKPFVLVLTTKTGAAYVDRELKKTLSAYDRAG